MAAAQAVGAAAAVPEEQTQITGSKALITITAMLAALMSVLDISIVNVGLAPASARRSIRSRGARPATRWRTSR
jgi:hypothetical protein